MKQEKTDFELYRQQQKQLLEKEKIEWQSQMEKERLEWRCKMEQEGKKVEEERQALSQQQEQVIVLKKEANETKMLYQKLMSQVDKEKKKLALLIADNIKHADELGAAEIKMAKQSSDSDELIQKVNQELTTIANNIAERSYYYCLVNGCIKDLEEKLKKNLVILLQQEQLLGQQDRQKETMLKVIEKLELKILELQQQIQYHIKQIANQEKMIKRGNDHLQQHQGPNSNVGLGVA